MPGDLVSSVVHLAAALAAGGAVGLERSERGRPAGLRTHALVALGAAVAMLVAIRYREWFPGAADATVRIDPTRVVQGVMIGIGFLGAGVIMREGLVLRGLTTAASIWMTAALGVLAGVGLWIPLAVATVLMLAVLDLFRRLEHRLAVERYFHHQLRFVVRHPPPEQEVRRLLARHGFTMAETGYRIAAAGSGIELVMTVFTRDAAAPARLAATLAEMDEVAGFELLPTGD